LLTLEDMGLINCIADTIHTTLSERSDVFLEKYILFPKGCQKLVLNGTLVGYGISHP
jgi:hypothetical protein